MKFIYLPTLLFLLLLTFAGSALAQDKKIYHIYNNICRVKGKIQILNHPELGVTPDSGGYVVFQRVDCKKCLIGVHADIDGNYEVLLGEGKYRIIMYQPSPPTYDLLAPDQPRYVTVGTASQPIEFNINIKLQFFKSTID